MPQPSTAVLGKLTHIAASAVQAVATRPDNDLSVTAVADAKPAIAAEIERAIVNAPSLDKLAVVEVKSSWLSKINWTAAIGVVASGIVAFVLPYLVNIGLPDQILAMFTVATVTQVLTWMFNTFFRDTVPPSSLPSK